MTTMRISQLADRTGFSATTLRFYETAGLLPADRTDTGYRVYGEEAVRRLAFIGSAKHLGLPLEEIAELLAIWESGACAEVKADLRPRLVARLAEAEQRVAELTAFTATLHSALRHLDELPDRDEPCDPDCEGALRDISAGPEPVEIACTLTASEAPERFAEWHAVLDGAIRREIPDGLRLTVPASRAADLAALAVAEQRCCAFFDFRIVLAGPDVHLEVRAPAEASHLLVGMFTSSP